ncbi:group II intron reverse transcriptase/maturase [Nonomuraea polychroma]|uniref:group II intron reverse transcriptase/maturase n=1 Tax=Nonomuraea polychroma TaxID=46176 RepID=UPI003D8B9DD3
MNGPEGGTWEPIAKRGLGMRQARDNVRRLRQRIFKAAQAGDLGKVRSLQKLMLRSYSNTLVSVERVTEINAGRKTAGVDGEVALTDTDRSGLVCRVHTERSWTVRPVKRVYIPKARDRTKLRPLGIPVIFDRVLQARTKNALEPEWEARFEPRSYGFRPGRGCHDAIEAVFNATRGRKALRTWILDADLAAAFDAISHDHLLAMLGTFPAREQIRGWLKAGVIDQGRFAPTEEGTPQGGVISPVLLNVALHGLEQAAGVRYRPSGVHAGEIHPDAPVVIRYADDYIAACHTQRQADEIKARLAAWLAPRGLAFNEGKTRIVHLTEGFDFLGFNVRRYHGGKLLIKPSAAALKRIRQRLREVFRAMRGATPSALIRTLNPIIRGWAAYYRTMVSSRAFARLDDYVWRLAYKWAKYRHPRKPKKWITARYFGRFHPSRNDRWVFGDRDSGVYLRKFSWTKIVRHQVVKAGASLDDPALADYWATRRRKSQTPLDERGQWRQPLHEQQGRCPLCGDYLLHADTEPATPQEWEQWLRATMKAITKHLIVESGREGGRPDRNRLRLVHTHCQRRSGTRPAHQRPTQPMRLA